MSKQMITISVEPRHVKAVAELANIMRRRLDAATIDAADDLVQAMLEAVAKEEGGKPVEEIVHGWLGL